MYTVHSKKTVMLNILDILKNIPMPSIGSHRPRSRIYSAVNTG